MQNFRKKLFLDNAFWRLLIAKMIIAAIPALLLYLFYPFNSPKPALIFLPFILFFMFSSDLWNRKIMTLSFYIGSLRFYSFALLVISLLFDILLPWSLPGIQILDELSPFVKLRSLLIMLSLIMFFLFLSVYFHKEGEYASLIVGASLLFLIFNFLIAIFLYISQTFLLATRISFIIFILIICFLRGQDSIKKSAQINLSDIVLLVVQWSLIFIALFPLIATGSVVDDDAWRMLAQSWHFIHGLPLQTFSKLTNFYPIFFPLSLSNAKSILGLPLQYVYVLLYFYVSIPLLLVYLLTKKLTRDLSVAVAAAIIFAFSTSFGGLSVVINQLIHAQVGHLDLWWAQVKWLDVLAGPSYTFQVNFLPQTLNVIFTLSGLFYYLQYKSTGSRFSLTMASIISALAFENGIIGIVMIIGIIILYEITTIEHPIRKLAGEFRHLMFYLIGSIGIILLCELFLNFYTLKASIVQVSNLPKRLALVGEVQNAFELVLLITMVLIIVIFVFVTYKLFLTNSKLISNNVRWLRIAFLAIVCFYIASIILAFLYPLDFASTTILPIYYILPPFGFMPLLAAFSIFSITKLSIRKIFPFITLWTVISLVVFCLFWRMKFYYFAVVPSSIIGSIAFVKELRRHFTPLFIISTLIIVSGFTSYFNNIVWVSSLYSGRINNDIIEAINWAQLNLPVNSTVLYLGEPQDSPPVVDPLSTLGGRLTQNSFFDWWCDYSAVRENMRMLTQCVDPEPVVALLIRYNIKYVFMEKKFALSNYSFVYHLLQQSMLVFENEEASIYRLTKSETLRFSSQNLAVIFDDNMSSLWKIEGWDLGNLSMKISDDELVKIKNANSLKIEVSEDGNKSYVNLRHIFSVSQNWSKANFMILYWRSMGQEPWVRITVLNDLSNYFYVFFKCEKADWNKIVINLQLFTKVGNPSWENVNEIWFTLSSPGIYYLDQLIIGEFPSVIE